MDVTNDDKLLSVTLVSADGTSSLGVVPEPIRLQSLRLQGEWHNFSLTWDATPVQHGNVTYQLICSYDGSEKPVKVRSTS